MQTLQVGMGVFWNPWDLLLKMATEIFKIDASWAEKLTKYESLNSNDANCMYFCVYDQQGFLMVLPKI